MSDRLSQNTMTRHGTDYSDARSANPGAFASAGDFVADDVITHAHALAATPLQVSSGTDDPFGPGVAALALALPSSAVVEIGPGCHDGAFFASRQHSALAFLGAHLGAS